MCFKQQIILLSFQKEFKAIVIGRRNLVHQITVHFIYKKKTANMKPIFSLLLFGQT